VISRFKKINPLFLATVVIPTVLAVLYFGFIASDVYISESRFVVRSPSQQSTSPLGDILKGAGFSRAEDDSYAVQNYILSHDAVKALDQELNIKMAYSKSSVDVFSRFPGLYWDASLENFLRFYRGHVDIQLDATSSIAALTVRAFTAQDAQEINKKLLEYAEALVNRLNERGRQDMLRYAMDDVKKMEEKVKSATVALADYRNENGVIDPEKQSEIPLQQIAKLQDEQIQTKAQILQIENVAKQNPQLPVLRQRASLIEQEIKAASLGVAGAGELSLAGKAAEFQRLVLEKEFADTMLASSMSSLEQARIEVQRQQLYLERIVQPNLPDEAWEPRRFRNILSIFILGLISWGVLAMLFAGIREHMD